MERKRFFNKEVFTECEINAPAAKVYEILSDFANLKKWTDGLVISGDTKPGGKMCVRVNIPNMGWQKLSSKMVKMEPGMIAFNNVVAAAFLFIGKHRFEILPVSENKTKLINAEVFSGLALPILKLKNFTDNVHKYKENTNLDLKKAIEVPAGLKKD